ncbi:MAG: hypothetical protein Q3968_01390 [Clostridiaceae bacterium]|jgi:hypothetical protein|nr:hypothetical protein [Clostridiaceae bacterium]
MGKRKRCVSIGTVFLFLGIGLVAALTVPAKYLVVMLAIALTVSGIAICRN